jgi:hypothetical protein
MNFTQILDTTQTQKYSVKKDVTVEDIEALTTFLDSIKPSGPREMVIHTGLAGGQIFNRWMVINTYEAHSTELLKKGKIGVEESNRLSKMLQSPDVENFEVAKTIIDNLMNEVRASIQIRGKSRNKRF